MPSPQAILTFLLAAGAAAPAPARQLAEDSGQGLLSLRQALLDASVDTRAVIVATHPDDTYRGLSLLLRRQWGADVTVLLATRGEGGQNAIGPELGAELGRIRTLEAVRAAERVLDVKLRFLDLPDFGYSRTAAEALDRWRGDAPFERLRSALDELAPDLLLTPHGPHEGHGQKRAVLLLLRRYVAARPAGRPRFFRAAAPGETAGVVLHLDRPDPWGGSTYQREAFRALEEHRTQQPHRPLEEASPPEIRLVGEGGAGSLLSGLPDLWTYEADLGRWLAHAGEPLPPAALRRRLQSLAGFPEIPGPRQDDDPTTRSLELLAVLQELRRQAGPGSDVRRRLGRRIEALARAALAGAIVRLGWDCPARFDCVRGRIEVPLRIWNGGVRKLGVRVKGLAGRSEALRLLGPDRKPPAGDPPAVEVPPAGQARVPLWLERTEVEPRTRRVGVALDLDVVLGRTTLSARVSRSIEWVRPLAIRPQPDARFLVPDAGGQIRLSLDFLKPRSTDLDALLAIAAPFGVTLLPESDRDPLPIHVALPAGTRQHRIPVRLRAAPWETTGSLHRPQPRLLRFYLEAEDGGPAPPAAGCEVRLDPVRIRLPQGLRIGIVRGPDDTVEETLTSLGLDVQGLDADSLARAGLDEFDTVIIGSRALLLRAGDLEPQVSRFVAYARRGGHLVVLYHKAQEFNEAETGVLLAPFPLVLGTERITREDAPVRVLLPRHPLMSRPNRLEPRDWDGWTQERGLYLPRRGAYDRRYEELLSIREPAMQELPELGGRTLTFEPQRGALLAARTGSGSYVYCALVIHRQLRIFHPGAARLLVNLVTPPGWRRFR